MPVEPPAHFRVLVGGVVVEDDVDELASWHLSLDGIEEADELLMPVTLHVAGDNRAVEHVEGSEEGRRAMPFVVVGYGAGAALLHGQAGLGAVERLDLALLVNRQHDGMGGRIDIEPDDVAQLVDEVGIVGELELPHPVRLQPVCAPDALHRADGDASLLGHHGTGPVGRLGGRVGERQGDDALDHLRPKRRDARGPRLVAQEAVEAFLHEALLPSPDAGFRLGRASHDLVGAEPIGGQQDDLRPPDMLLGGVAVPDQGLKVPAVSRRDGDGNPRAHAPDSHATHRPGIPRGIPALDFIH